MGKIKSNRRVCVWSYSRSCDKEDMSEEVILNRHLDEVREKAEGRLEGILKDGEQKQEQGGDELEWRTVKGHCDWSRLSRDKSRRGVWGWCVKEVGSQGSAGARLKSLPGHSKVWDCTLRE